MPVYIFVFLETLTRADIDLVVNFSSVPLLRLFPSYVDRLNSTLTWFITVVNHRMARRLSLFRHCHPLAPTPTSILLVTSIFNVCTNRCCYVYREKYGTDSGVCSEILLWRRRPWNCFSGRRVKETLLTLTFNIKLWTTHDTILSFSYNCPNKFWWHVIFDEGKCPMFHLNTFTDNKVKSLKTSEHYLEILRSKLLPSF